MVVELVDTEDSHCKTLGIINELFYKPIAEANCCSEDVMKQLFPDIEPVLRLHTQFRDDLQGKPDCSAKVSEIVDLVVNRVSNAYYRKFSTSHLFLKKSIINRMSD